MKFALPFFDDSTLIFAARIQRLLIDAGQEAHTIFEQEAVETLSQRQIAGHLPSGPDLTKVGELDDSEAAHFDAVITSKSKASLRSKLARKAFRNIRDRPAYIAFQPGLEFTPEKGMSNRRNFDIIFFNSEAHKTLYDNRFRRTGSYQETAVGHPYFLANSYAAQGTDIIFFAQAISPATYDARRFILDVLITIAEAYPDRKVILKLRHLRGENAAHVHREMFDYQTILDENFSNLPKNFQVSIDPISAIMKAAGLCITCTSTAAMDAISRNIPTMVYLDYPEYYLDQFATSMRDEFGESGLIVSLPRLLRLDHGRPRKSWYEARFRTELELVSQLLRLVTDFKSR